MATSNQFPIHHAVAPVNTVARFIRVLVVDDMPAMAETISSILAMYPWVRVVGTAKDGLAAIKTALATAPDLLVMDINMPVMNGLRAAMHIKRRLPDTRIILVSSDDDPAVALAAMDCGADGFLPKAKLASRGDWHIRRLFGDNVDVLPVP